MRKITLFISLIILVTHTGCDVNNSDNADSLYLEIVNDVASVSTEEPYNNLLSGTIQVTITPNKTDPEWDGYEGINSVTLQEGVTSSALQVSNRFQLKVNGMDFAPNQLGISNPPSDTWILKIQAIQQFSDSYSYAFDLSIK